MKLFPYASVQPPRVLIDLPNHGSIFISLEDAKRLLNDLKAAMEGV